MRVTQQRAQPTRATDPSAKKSIGFSLLLTTWLSACATETPVSNGSGDSPSLEATATQQATAIFRDITDDTGLDFEHQHGGTGKKYLPEIMGAGGCVLDFDGDGWLDLYLVQSGPVPGASESSGPHLVNRLYRNRGTLPLSFEDVTDGSGAGDRGYGMGAVAGDYDNDGDTDIYVVNLGPDVLLRNDGGKFTDVTTESGIDSPLWGSSAAFLDADLDGHLDLYVVNYLEYSVATNVDCGTPSKGILSYCHPDVYEMAPDVFFRNRGDGTFEDATRAAGLVDSTGKGLGVVSADLTGDGWPDIHVANDSTPNFLYRNKGDGTFEEAGLLLGVGYNEEGLTEAGMGNAIGDVDGDGDLDLFVTNLTGETNALYLAGDVLFDYATRQSGLYAGSYMPVGFGTDMLDLDYDGDLDILVTNGHVIDNVELIDDSQTFRQPAQVFLNDGNAGFTEAPPEKAGDVSTPRVGRGTLTADFDNDGRFEVVITFNNDRARIFANQLEPGSWIGFDLQGTQVHRDAIGARVTVEAAGRRWVEIRTAGSSYQTSSDPRLVFALGSAQAIERVIVDWPGGESEIFSGLEIGRYHSLREGSGP